jgi:alpha-beta hydrolase superfamily lysophospholipase
LASGLAPQTPIATPIEPEMFTTTPKFLEYIRNDPLRLHYSSARFFMVSHRAEKAIDRRMPENRLPILLFLAGNDRIIDNEGVLQVLNRGDSERLEVITYADQTHSVQFDAPERLVGHMAEWIERQRGSAKAGSRSPQ